MLVEFVGPSGVGKSTILHTGRENAPVGASKWLNRHELPPRVVDEIRCVDGEDFADLVNFSIERLSRSRSLPSQKIVTLTLLRRAIADWVHVSNLQWRAPVIHDELVLNRIFSVLLFSDDIEQGVNDFMALAPRADAVIIGTAPPEEIFARIRARPRRVNVYHSISDLELMVNLRSAVTVCIAMHELLKQEGIPVLLLDTSVSVEESGSKMGQWLTDIAKSEDNDIG